MDLSKSLIKRAEKELREDENRKKQSFELLQQWLHKHPFINVLDPEFLSKFASDLVLKFYFRSLEFWFSSSDTMLL